ncbi:MAG: helix-turn-helix domain-containing protein [Acidimicrobiia bacterium]|nr:helix-turn-helix domain-containing protein [Acidimicrobiia bacterium]
MSLRDARHAAGFTQGELAARAGVSRQLISAVEVGRHLPRIDAALALAGALGTRVDELFGARRAPEDIRTGAVPPRGTVVRAGLVGDRVVTAPLTSERSGWGVGDAVVRDGSVEWLSPRTAGLVVVGCEPGLHLLERLLRERGMGSIAVLASNAVALDALVAGRAHAAVVHGQPETLVAPEGVDRFRIATWRVGLTSDAAGDWVRGALAGKMPVIQREQGAGVQNTFEAAVDAVSLPIAGPTVGGHVEAAERSLLLGLPAVTIEPAATALGLGFHPLATHEVELWVDARWRGDRLVSDAVNTMVTRRFIARLEAVGGYDLSRVGSQIA